MKAQCLKHRDKGLVIFQSSALYSPVHLLPKLSMIKANLQDLQQTLLSMLEAECNLNKNIIPSPRKITTKPFFWAR